MKFYITSRTASLKLPFYYIGLLDYRLHRCHISTELSAYNFDWVVADFGIYCNKLGVVYSIVLNIEAFADYICMKFWHKVFCHHRGGNPCTQVATVFSSVGNYAVHFVEAFAVNEVCDERKFVQ